MAAMLDSNASLDADAAYRALNTLSFAVSIKGGSLLASGNCCAHNLLQLPVGGRRCTRLRLQRFRKCSLETCCPQVGMRRNACAS